MSRPICAASCSSQRTCAVAASAVAALGQTLLECFQSEGQSRHGLSDLIVQFSRNPPLLLFLGRSQPTKQMRTLGLRALEDIDVGQHAVNHMTPVGRSFRPSRRAQPVFSAIVRIESGIRRCRICRSRGRSPPNEARAARCGGSICAKIRSADHLVSPDRRLGKPSNAQKRLQPLNSFAVRSQRHVPSSAASIASAPRFSLSSSAAADCKRLHAAPLRDFAGDHQSKRDGEPDTRRRSCEQQPQRAGHGRIQFRHGNTNMDRPPFRAGKDAVDGFDIHALPRLGSSRIRAAARNGFLHGRCCRTCTGGPGVRACARRSFPWRQ